MPTYDADAAREWRTRFLNPAKVAPDPGPSSSTLIARLYRLRDLAEAARAAGRLDLVLDPIRDALRAVPPPANNDVQLQPWLWEALIGPHAMAVLNEGRRDKSEEQLAIGEAEELGQLVGLLATGEAQILP